MRYETNTAISHTYPKAIQLPPLRPVFYMEEGEIPYRKLLPLEAPLPYAIFIDDELLVHFEINNWIGSFSRPRWHDFLHPDDFYSRIAPEIIEGSLLRKERHLIGGITGIYYPEGRYSDIHVVGLLPRDKTSHMPVQDRRQAFGRMCEGMDALNHWLGATELRSGYTVIAPAKMKAVGWEQQKLCRLRDLAAFYWKSFPIWLRRKQGYYVKKLG